MSVKLIAVDMDGSFLSDAKTYNRARFLAQYARMKAQGIRFVVASGNQYYQLISFFPEIAHEIAFVAENGGWVVDAGEDVFNGELSKEHFLTVATLLNDVPGIEIIACGKNSAYTLKTYNDLFKRLLRNTITALKASVALTTSTIFSSNSGLTSLTTKFRAFRRCCMRSLATSWCR